MKNRLILLIAVVAVCLVAQPAGARTRREREPRKILVSAATSLTDAFKQIGAEFTKKHPDIKVEFNFAASGVLERQIQQGAPVDVFASAGEKEMDELVKHGSVQKGSVEIFATNRLALIARVGSTLKGWKDLAKAEVHRIALPKPDSVPSGRYGKETLQHRKLWEVVQPKLVYSENVRQALTYVANGDADAGVVFVTDARVDSAKVRVVALDDLKSDHGSILYPLAPVARSQDQADAKLFRAFLVSPVAQRILAGFGFSRPGSFELPE